jgi:hypothetical protein
LCRYLFQKELIFPWRKICPRKILCGLEVEVIEFTINDVREFLGINHPRTFPVIFITSLVGAVCGCLTKS